jgi:hypothetical protein
VLEKLNANSSEIAGLRGDLAAAQEKWAKYAHDRQTSNSAGAGDARSTGDAAAAPPAAAAAAVDVDGGNDEKANYNNNDDDGNVGSDDGNTNDGNDVNDAGDLSGTSGVGDTVDGNIVKESSELELRIAAIESLLRGEQTITVEEEVEVEADMRAPTPEGRNISSARSTRSRTNLLPISRSVSRAGTPMPVTCAYAIEINLLLTHAGAYT